MTNKNSETTDRALDLLTDDLDVHPISGPNAGIESSAEVNDVDGRDCGHRNQGTEPTEPTHGVVISVPGSMQTEEVCLWLKGELLTDDGLLRFERVVVSSDNAPPLCETNFCEAVGLVMALGYVTVFHGHANKGVPFSVHAAIASDGPLDTDALRNFFG